MNFICYNCHMDKNVSRKSEKESFSIVKRAKSFTHASNGVRIFIRTTHNAWIHILISALAIWLGFNLGITTTEWMFLVMAIGLVMVTECINTAFEFDIDLTSPKYHPYAKYTKDVSAGAVLIASITASVIGLIIFLPKIFFDS